LEVVGVSTATAAACTLPGWAMPNRVTREPPFIPLREAPAWQPAWCDSGGQQVKDLLPGKHESFLRIAHPLVATGVDGGWAPAPADTLRGEALVAFARCLQAWDSDPIFVALWAGRTRLHRLFPDVYWTALIPPNGRHSSTWPTPYFTFEVTADALVELDQVCGCGPSLAWSVSGSWTFANTLDAPASYFACRRALADKLCALPNLNVQSVQRDDFQA
jgi:hypothetical protein